MRKYSKVYPDYCNGCDKEEAAAIGVCSVCRTGPCWHPPDCLRVWDEVIKKSQLYSVGRCLKCDIEAVLKIGKNAEWVALTPAWGCEHLGMSGGEVFYTNENCPLIVWDEKPI